MHSSRSSFSRRAMVATLAAAAFGLAGCSSEPKPVAKVYNLGEMVSLGKLTYTTLGAEYRTQITGITKMPTSRFLIVQLSIKNDGTDVANIPSFKLLGPNGQELPEVMDIEGWGDSLGYIRQLQVGQTMTGSIVFDVPMSAYKLELTNGGDPAVEKIAYVELPATIVTAEPKLAAPGTDPVPPNAGMAPTAPAPAAPVPAKK